MEKIQKEIEETSKYLTAKQKEFDSVTDVSRGIIRDSASAITMLHNNDPKGAAKMIKAAYAGVKKLKKSDTKFEYYSRQAYQEYAEATIFFGIKTKEMIPSLNETGVEAEAYLLGLMDVMGELKREILEELRNDNVKKAEFYFSKMRLIYDSTRSLRFAEAILNGFRKKQDVARIQLEGAGSEMLSSKSTKHVC